MFHHNNRGKIDYYSSKIMIFAKKQKILVWCDDPPEDRVISIVAGCLANHDRTHSHLTNCDQCTIVSFPHSTYRMVVFSLGLGYTCYNLETSRKQVATHYGNDVMTTRQTRTFRVSTITPSIVQGSVGEDPILDFITSE
jgi:hypothetical protein